MKKYINEFTKGLETIQRGDDLQEVCTCAGILLDLTKDFAFNQQQEIYNNKDVKKYVGNISSTALMLLTDKEITWNDEISKLLNITSLNFAAELNEYQMQILNGLFYKYDKDFKGDKDFYPECEEIQQLLNI